MLETPVYVLQHSVMTTSREWLRDHWLRTVREHNRPYVEDQLLQQVEASLSFLTDSEVDQYVAVLKSRRIQ